MSQKQMLNNLIADDNLEQVITELRSITANIPNLNKEVLHLSGQFEKNEKQRRLNEIDNDTFTRDKNKIREALLSVVKRLPESGINPLMKKNNWLKISALIVGTLGILASIATISGVTLKDIFGVKSIQAPTDTTIKKPEVTKQPVTVPKTVVVPPPKPQTETVKIAETKPKYISVALIVDAAFSKAEIFANGKPVYPIKMKVH